MSSVSSAMRRRASGGMWSSVRMLCSRSASLTSSTRTSSAIASRSLRRFSACLASLVTRSSFLSLVRPSTSAPISGPNSSSISARVAVGVLDRVVQQRRGDGRVVELEVGEDRRDFERMGEIGVARGALLLAMRLHGVDIGAVEQGLVGVRIVALDPLDQVVLPHHLRLRPRLAYGFSRLARQSCRLRSSGARAPGLVLHARQIGRGARHARILAAQPISGRHLHQDITAIVSAPQGVGVKALPKTQRPGLAGPCR